MKKAEKKQSKNLIPLIVESFLADDNNPDLLVNINEKAELLERKLVG